MGCPVFDCDIQGVFITSAKGQPLSSRDTRSPYSTHAREEWVAIVDDDPSIRSALALVLRLEGIRAETFASAEEFLERLHRGAPRCLVLDVQLRGRNGFELQDQLVSQGTALPIIFISARESIPAARLAPPTGASGFLRKPFDAAELVALIIPLLGRATSGEVDH